MARYLLLLTGLLVMLALQPGYGFHEKLPEGLTPEQATWLWGHHSIPGDITKSGTPYWYVYPHTDVNQITNPTWSEVAATHIKPGTKAPAVLVMHGCAGIPRGTTEYRRFFIETGYAVFEPDSFARYGDGPGAKRCGKASYRARIKEVEQALIEIRKLDWVDHEQIFLMGFDEGGSVVAGWEKDGFVGHIILAANCWRRRGTVPAGPKKVPVLAIVGEKDPYLNGAKCSVNPNIPGSKSIVIKDAGYFVLAYPETGAAIVEFFSIVAKK